MYEKLEECPVCKHSQFTNHLICDDHSVSGESFALVKCKKCSLVFTNPRPEQGALPDYYQSDQYISHTDKGNSLINFIYKLVRKYTIRRKVKLIDKLNRGQGSLLDYGCGTGDFIKTANKKGWHAYGYEPDKDAQNIASSKNPDKLLDRIENHKDQFNIITAWHVIEHVSELNKTIKTLKKQLATDGHLIIALPNHKSYDAAFYKEYWAGYDVPRHLYHFDQESIKSFATKFKLRLIHTLPMKFDSYYVSMLSEKYKGKSNLLNALKIGLNSNNKAIKTNDYSSLIYIFKK
ncbi:class I SAM-dependent methyltransferase [Ekhidna sp.]|uniref:class I SAM-dependent methyltransferase n=1 Tax=Ekhidna sp. TaxID=2608089 RepID=UPI003C7E86F1